MSFEHIRSLKEPDMTTARPKTQREGILNPDIWPYWPFLPMKRARPYPDGLQTAVLYWPFTDCNPTDDSLFTLYIDANVFALSPEIMEKADKKEYQGLDAMLKDGWVAD